MSKAATRWQVVKTAADELGYTERGNNITKYWAARYPAWQGQPWCGAFVDWVLAQRGVDGFPIGRNGIFYTPSIVAAARSKGVWRSEGNLHSIKPGDLVLFDFDLSGNAKHVGFAEKYLGSGVVQTIEGNTSSGTAGSQNDGGGVYRRARTGASIMGFVDMTPVLAKDQSELTGKRPPAPRTERSIWLGKLIAEHGTLSVGTLKRLQAEVNTDIDGILGPATRKAVQRWLGVSPDGIWGPQTYSAMQAKVGASNRTGRWTPWLCTALQRWLNQNRRS